MATISYKYPYYSTDESGKWIHYNENFSALVEPSQEYIDARKTEEFNDIKEFVLRNLEASCDDIINNGFDVILSDNSTEHFTLSQEDQLNLSSAEQAIKSGATSFPYHCKNGTCKIYNSDDILKIINTATIFKTYNITYLNCLKEIVNNSNDIDEIESISYGDQLPDDYQEKLDNIIDSITQNMLTI